MRKLDGLEDGRIAVHIENGSGELPRVTQEGTELAPGQDTVADLDPLRHLKDQPCL